MEDPEKRWFRFSVDMQSVILLERKGLAEHLSGLPSVDTPAPLGDLIRDLEDAGEAGKGTLF